jgi:branched-chain amino acid aminotransferase
MSAALEVIRTTAPKAKPPADGLGFGKFFTDHMLTMAWDEGIGWHDARVEPYGPFSLEPSALVYHYGQAIFEGMKAYRTADGSIKVFRPRDYLSRMNRSAARLCIPPIDTDSVRRALFELLRLDRDWVPAGEGTSLYIRPFIIAVDPYIGVKVASSYRFFVILSPVGAYYARGFKPVDIWVEPDMVRAARGGLGEAKTAGNYAASLLASQNAKARGYDQVLWLDAETKRFIEEVGTMNLFLKIGGTVVTPPLEGSILGGMTRDSVLTLLRDWKVPVEERRVSIEEVFAAGAAGTLEEVFGTGTAAVVSPVGSLDWGGRKITVNGGAIGPTATRLFREISGIQYGTIPDRFGWLESIG